MRCPACHKDIPGPTAGAKNGRSKLTPKKVEEIRIMWDLYSKRKAGGDLTLGKIAKQYRVGKTTVGLMLRGETWKT